MTRFSPVLGNDWLFIARRPGKIMPTGCKQCQDLGYSGRTGVFELWRLDEEDYQLIMNHANEHALRERLAGKSHQALVHDAFAKVLNSTTSLAEMRKLSLAPSAGRSRHVSL